MNLPLSKEQGIDNMMNNNLIPIYLAWGDEAVKRSEQVCLPTQILVNGKWILNLDGTIIQHCPEEGYPYDVSYVSAQLCEQESRARFLDLINYRYSKTQTYRFEVYIWKENCYEI